jgi:hypothetical protein
VQPLGSPREVQLFGQDNNRVQVTHFDRGEHHSNSFYAKRNGSVNALYLIQEPPGGRKQQKRRADHQRKEDYSLAQNILMLFAIKLFLS